MNILIWAVVATVLAVGSGICCYFTAKIRRNHIPEFKPENTGYDLVEVRRLLERAMEEESRIEAQVEELSNAIIDMGVEAKISSVPAGITIEINGQPAGKTPFSYEFAGRRDFSIKAIAVAQGQADLEFKLDLFDSPPDWIRFDMEKNKVLR